MTNEMVETEDGPRINPQAAYYAKFMQLDLEMHRPSFAFSITEQRQRRHGIEIETRIGGSAVEFEAESRIGKQVDLLTPPQRKQLNAAFNRVNRYVCDPSLTVESPIRGLRMLPEARREFFFSNWTTVKARFNLDIARFFEIYDEEIVARCDQVIRPAIGDGLYREVAKHHLPPLEQLRSRFSVQVIVGQFNYQEAREAEKAIHFLADKVRKNLTTALEGLSFRLQDGSKLTPATLNDLRIALDGMKSFAAIGDAALLGEVEKMDRVLTRVTDRCNSAKDMGLKMTDVVKGYAETLNGAIDSVTKAANSSSGMNEALRKFGVQPRRIGRIAPTE